MSKKPIWTPSKKRIAQANITQFSKRIQEVYLPTLETYEDLYQWSINSPELFWNEIWDFFEIIGDKGSDRVLIYEDATTNEMSNEMLRASWFPDATLNFAQNILKHRDDREALVFWNEKKERTSVSFKDLYLKVSSCSNYLRSIGVKPGDRVAAFLPNIPEAIITMLAATSIGAVWSSCSPDFGVEGVLERFKQIEPRVIIVCDGYLYKGKEIDCRQKISDILDKLHTIEKIITVPFLGLDHKLETSIEFAEVLKSDSTRLEFEQLPFDHPLYIMFSSGTTGVPKCIVHGVGGTLLEHLKELGLHLDFKKEDRVFQYTTCGWMMWNLYVSSLSIGSTFLLYDGSPFFPDGNILFDLAQSEKMNVFGTSAKFISALENAGLCPMKTHDLSSLQTITSTGSPLMPENYDYVYSQIKEDLCLSSISGGTDIIGCFALGNPTLPVYQGELQCRSLGLKVEVYDELGGDLLEEKGELVCTKPFPNMPIYFWNDEDNKRYYNSYFDIYPNVWCHGDWVELTVNNGLIIYGRSDATLNPSGVRIGTAEIYRQVEKFEEIAESLAVGQSWKDDQRIVLFTVLNEGYQLTNELKERLGKEIKTNCTVRHVPSKIISVAALPRTISGKIAELSVKKIIHGQEVKNSSAMANPEALDLFYNLEELTKD